MQTMPSESAPPGHYGYVGTFSAHRISPYPLPFENAFCCTPESCMDVEVLFLGSGIGLSCAHYLQESALQILGRPLRIVVADAGPFDLYTHMAHTKLPRRILLDASTERFGGKLLLWGMSAPRPPEDILHRWPYSYEDLIHRFETVEVEMGVPEPIPLSGRALERRLQDLLATRFPQRKTQSAPLAIDRDGRRWCPVDDMPSLVQRGVKMLPRFRGTQIEVINGRVASLRGHWFDGRSWIFRPRILVLGVGVEASLPLVSQVAGLSVSVEAADHHRIDLHGSLAGNAFGDFNMEELGVAVLLMECRSREGGIPYHLEIKVAPRDLWNRGFMPSGDNLRGAQKDTSLWVQIQAIGTMHDRFPAMDLLNVASTFPPVMSARDASLHGEIVAVMSEVAATIGLSEPAFNMRPLLTNHHLYGAFRVGKAVDSSFRFNGVENLFVLPPTAFVDADDDANPTLKSRVLSQYAMNAIVSDFTSERLHESV